MLLIFGFIAACALQPNCSREPGANGAMLATVRVLGGKSAAHVTGSENQSNCDIDSSPYTISFRRELDLDRVERDQVILDFYLTNNLKQDVETIAGLATVTANGVTRSVGTTSGFRIPGGSSAVLETEIAFNGDEAGRAIFIDEPLKNMTYKWTTTRIELGDGSAVKCKP